MAREILHVNLSPAVPRGWELSGLFLWPEVHVCTNVCVYTRMIIHFNHGETSTCLYKSLHSPRPAVYEVNGFLLLKTRPVEIGSREKAHTPDMAFCPLSLLLFSLNILPFPGFQWASSDSRVTSLRGDDNTTKGRGYEIEKFYFRHPGHSSACNSRKWIHYLVPTFHYLRN